VRLELVVSAAGLCGQEVVPMTKTDKEKGEELLKKRERARKGLAENKDEGEDTIEEQEEREKKIADNALAVGLAVRRSG
jgi:hypothetical protein